MVHTAEATVSNIMRDEKTGAVKAGLSVAGFDTGKVMKPFKKVLKQVLSNPKTI